MNDASKQAEKKAEQIEREAKAAELLDSDLDRVAGGVGPKRNKGVVVARGGDA